ncbi:dihydropteroate synthase [Aquaspirillum sp. LM1]|jgi:dihydropteroate synthase|uniref:dihydropteroate synthase n=1 Tax=Aquaspirillum sp. LM1 TaxID=1938604 RepID=UPI000983A922|nr:dihydropteroate synthase [Aquaspirillum sp. LM1]AQR65580.1 dihydropteroate synthase [Aquaspirillum sp. LM1]
MSAATLHAGRFVLSLQRPLIMGILNVTPDSFSDGGRYLLPDAARARAEAMLAEGADLLDIGGESTRPNAPLVSEQEEIDRVLPVLEALRDYPVPISLDTRRTAVMRAGLALGVDLINDVAALEDEGAIAAVAASSAAVCLMHKQGTPQTMQQAPQYRDVVAEVIDYLAARAHAALAGGIAASRLLVDPGFGFGKTVEHNYALLARLGECARLAPVLAGLSRKSMLGAVTGQDVPARRVAASVAAALLACQHGAAIVRVHDVAETRDALAVWQAMRATQRAC